MKNPWAWFTLMGVPVVAILAFTIYKPILVLPRIGLAPGFSLTTQAGERLTSEDLRGQLVLYTFGYSHCQVPCPQNHQTMQRLQSEINQSEPKAGDGIQPPELRLVTISVDPTRDTPEQLRDLAQQVGADKDVWTFATGAPDTVKQIVGGGFSTYYTQSPSGSIDVDPAFILVDGWGIQRAEYRTEFPDIGTILRDIDLLRKEAQNSQGAMRYAYEAAHLFLCYP